MTDYRMWRDNSFGIMMTYADEIFTEVSMLTSVSINALPELQPHSPGG